MNDPTPARLTVPARTVLKIITTEAPPAYIETTEERPIMETLQAYADTTGRTVTAYSVGVTINGEVKP